MAEFSARHLPFSPLISPSCIFLQTPQGGGTPRMSMSGGLGRSSMAGNVAGVGAPPRRSMAGGGTLTSGAEVSRLQQQLEAAASENERLAQSLREQAGEAAKVGAGQRRGRLAGEGPSGASQIMTRRHGWRHPSCMHSPLHTSCSACSSNPS